MRGHRSGGDREITAPQGPSVGWRCPRHREHPQQCGCHFPQPSASPRGPLLIPHPYALWAQPALLLWLPPRPTGMCSDLRRGSLAMLPHPCRDPLPGLCPHVGNGEGSTGAPGPRSGTWPTAGNPRVKHASRHVGRAGTAGPALRRSGKATACSTGLQVGGSCPRRTSDLATANSLERAREGGPSAGRLLPT